MPGLPKIEKRHNCRGKFEPFREKSKGQKIRVYKQNHE